MGAVAKLKPMIQMAGDLAAGRYPAAVYGRPAPARQLPPVFCLHSVTSAPFEALLQSLTRDGYRTLTCEEYLGRLRGEGPGTEGRELLLTFDDGVAQMWSVAWPLLEKYNHRATVFIIPGRIQPGAGPRRPTLREVWAGQADLAAVDTLDASDQPLATWRELREIQASGILDCQSHTFGHRRVFTGRQIVGFVSPDYIARSHAHDMALWPLPAGKSYEPPALGWPLFTTGSRMQDGPAVRVPASLNDACADFVQQQGGASFFDQAGWHDRLLAFANGRLAGNGQAFEAEPVDAMRAAMRDDLSRSRELTESNLPGHTCRHLALPWGVGSDASVRAARDAGFATCFWGRVDGRLANHVGDDPMRLARIGEDFIPCLPGEHRIGVGRVVMNKLRRAAGR